MKLLFICLISVICSAKVYAQDHQLATELTIVTEHLPPFQIEHEDKVLGFATKIIETALANTPYQYSIRVYPWTRAMRMVEAKENVCIYSIARTPERENKFIWVNTIAKREASFVGLKAQNLKVESFQDAKQFKTAVIRDDVTHQYLLNEGFEEGKNLYVLDNTHSLLKLLTKRNGIDLILVDANTIKYRAQFNDLDPDIFQKVFQINEKPMDYYLACNINTSNEVIERLKASIDSMKQSGKLQLIITQWQYPAIKVEN